MKSGITIVIPPVSRWQEYKQLRLESLRKESQAFGAKYTDAKIKSDEEWIERVKASEKMIKILCYSRKIKENLLE